MKNRKVLIRNSLFALVAAIVLLMAYFLPQTAKKTELPQVETKTEVSNNEIDILESAPEAQLPSENGGDVTAEDAEVTDGTEVLPPEDAQVAEEASPAAEPLAEENTAPGPINTPSAPETQTSPAPQETELYCTLSVRCDTILNNMSSLHDGKADLVPQNGVIYEERRVKFNEGESVFNVLQREMKINRIHMEFVNAPLYGSAYIEGIGNLYEFDCGDLSGWMYKVNGVFPNYGCSQYKLSPGDKIEWVYTCNLGEDVGGKENARNGRKNETE